MAVFKDALEGPPKLIVFHNDFFHESASWRVTSKIIQHPGVANHSAASPFSNLPAWMYFFTWAVSAPVMAMEDANLRISSPRTNDAGLLDRSAHKALPTTPVTI